MTVVIRGGGGAAGTASVDGGNNLAVTLPLDSTKAGFGIVGSQVDAGAVTGTPRVLSPETSSDYRLRVGLDTPDLFVTFEGTVVPQALLQQSTLTMTAVQAAGFLALNAAGNTANGSYAIARTYRTLSVFGTYDRYGEMWARHSNTSATGTVSEWGFGSVSATTAAASDGAFFRIASGGALFGVVSFNGTETATAAITTTAISNRDGTTPFDYSKTAHYLVDVHHDRVEFWINDVLAGVIPTPAAQPLPVSASSQPMFGRVYNSGTASAGRQLQIGYMTSSIGDAQTGKPWPHVLAGAGGGSYQVQPGTASGQTATFANGAAPVAGSFTASTAPATNTLGGKWISPTLPLGAESDYPLFAYLNPAGTAVLPGKTLYVTGIRIGETFVSTTLGASATVLEWGVGIGSTASSLATSDGATTLGPRRLALGTQAFAATAAAGVMASAIQYTPMTPWVVPAGTYFHVILRLLLNAATGVLRGSVTIDGYFE